MEERVRPRQAVIFIHGIGEQRPMQKMRAFVNALFPNSEVVSNEPDRIAGLYELRRLTVREPKIPWTTDFFELYWAHHMRDTKYRQVAAWMLNLLRRKPPRTDGGVLFVWWVAWLSIALFVAAVLMVWPVQAVLPLVSAVRGTFIGAAALSLVGAWFSGQMLFKIGDAARYLEPSADNIEQREAVRKDGLRLLEDLHECGKYDRIIIAAHSLGSVIAYDIVRLAWERMCDGALGTSAIGLQPALVQAERSANDLWPQYWLADPFNPSAEKRTAALRAKWRADQRDLWKEQRARGGGWLVSDVVTFGSPLAHASYLLEIDSRALLLERVYPTCPPALSRDGSFAEIPEAAQVPGTNPTGREPGYWAPFSVVRWTNLYFPGDFVGGRVELSFGPGVEDRKVLLDGGLLAWIGSRLLLSHGKYFRPARRVKGTDGKPTWKRPSSVEALAEALDLGSEDLLPEDATCPAGEHV